MSNVGKVTIDPVSRPAGTTRHVRATVNVGGSLVEVECDTEQDSELADLVDHLCSRLQTIALSAVQSSLHTEQRSERHGETSQV